MGEKMQIVVVDWGGAPAPQKWYRRLEKLFSLSARKASATADEAVMVQEGVVLCRSHSLARTIAALATQGVEVQRKTKYGSRLKVCKPASVTIGEVELEDFEVGTAEYRALGRMEEVFSRTGKKKNREWTVTCYEEMAAHVHTTHAVVNCPVCGGTNIKHREGVERRYADPGGDVVLAWLRLRFAGGRWEPPQPGTELPPEVPAAITEPEEKKFVEALRTSPLRAQLERVSRDRAFTLLDAALVARVHWDSARRLSARLAALAALLQAQERPDLGCISVVEQPGVIDVLDVAGPLGPEAAAMTVLALTQREKETPTKAAPERKVERAVVSVFVPPMATRSGVAVVGV